MASFSESIKTLLTVDESCLELWTFSVTLQHYLKLWKCQDGYHADANSSVFELL